MASLNKITPANPNATGKLTASQKAKADTFPAHSSNVYGVTRYNYVASVVRLGKNS